ncbi:MAG: VWA-like domain-containing protein, partial [Pseudomonadota bacterium]
MAGHSHRAAFALQKLAEDDPALGALALWCKHRDGEGAEGAAAWTAGETIHYGPAFTALAPHEQVGLAAHHVLHVAFRHGARSNGLRLRFGERYQGDVYNIAADAIVNETLTRAGYALPRPAVTLAALVAKLRLAEPAREKALATLDADALYVLLALDRGGSAGGQSGTEEDKSRAERVLAAAEQLGFAPDLEDDPSEAPEQLGTADDAEWSQRLAFALEQGRRAGRCLGALGLRLQDLPQVTTPWEVVLRRLMTKALTQDRAPDYRRPARRWLALEGSARQRGTDQPAFLPATRQDRELPRIVIGLDTSGSVDTLRLKNFAAQVTAIARRARAELHLLVFDLTVRSHTLLTGPNIAERIAKIAFARDGGTSFVDVIDEAAALDPSII